MKNPLISICIPVYNTEQFLEECLLSIINQEYFNYEIVLVNDYSYGTDEQKRNCKKIVKSIKKSVFFKKNKIKITYIEHSANKGLVETRRSLVYNSNGKYIFMLDSDDLLAPQSLQKIAEIAENHDYDIIQGTSKSFNEKSFINNSSSSCFFGKLTDSDIFNNFFLHHTISPFLWGKLIKKEIYLSALENIPFTYCNVAEDLLQFFFISKVAKSYLGVDCCVYHYRILAGMTSNKKIDNLHNWEMVCSTASVFTILFDWCNQYNQKNPQNQLSKEEMHRLQDYSFNYLRNNLIQFENAVIPELKTDAYNLLCEYWGKSFVEHVKQICSE